MGRVYKAWDPLVRRVVAIKTIRSEYLTHETSEEYLRRFRREAQAAGRLSHPNIVGIYDVGEDYFVMEFLEGVSLQAILAHRVMLPPSEALRILTPVAEAIDYAHHAGVIHRDVKPANIMIQPDGRAKLMDFGVARLPTSAITDSGQSFGSPSYMAPELIASDDVTPRADLFSFGVVAYETLTGRRPFQGDSITAIIYRIVHEPAPPPRAYNDDLPPHHDEVFRRALAKEPTNRFPTAQSFVAALAGEELTLPEELLEPLGAAPPRDPSGELTTHLLKRRPDGTIEDDEPAPRRWLPWVVAAAALLALSAEVVALRRGGPMPAAIRRPPPAPEGLRIETRPPGASVWMDGRAAGEAPLTVKDLRPGMHQLRLTLEGHAPAELTFDVPEGTNALPLSFTMPPLMAPAEIRSDPEAATVTVDNRVDPARPRAARPHARQAGEPDPAAADRGDAGRAGPERDAASADLGRARAIFEGRPPAAPAGNGRSGDDRGRERRPARRADPPGGVGAAGRDGGRGGLQVPLRARDQGRGQGQGSPHI